MFDPQLQNYINEALNRVRAESNANLNKVAGAFRQQLAQEQRAAADNLSSLAKIASSLQIAMVRSQTTNGKVRIDDLPGRRVPFDLLVDIPIQNNSTSKQQGSVTISQDGPFVATHRYVAFQSAMQAVYTSDGTQSTFMGRSYGRYRPVSSVADYNDAGGGNASYNVTLPYATATSPGLGILELPSSMSGFRTMEFDGRFEVVNEGSGYPRQNITVPSAMWSHGIQAPIELSALDFYERGEVITFKAQPNHVNNPPFGNVNGLSIFGSAGFPFLEGQYDRHEGIATPGGFTFPGSVFTRITTDVIQRLPDGILTIGFKGFRIEQPVGPVT